MILLSHCVSTLQSVLTNFKEGNRVDMLLDMFRNIFPDNLFTATFRLYQTKVSTKEVNISDGNSSALVEKFQDGYIDSMNILGKVLPCYQLSPATNYRHQKIKHSYFSNGHIF